MKPMPLWAGAGKAALHFREEDFPLEGFAAQHDALCVRALLLQADTTLLLLSLELTSLPPQAVARYQALAGQLAGVAPQSVLVSVTHTFSAPHLPWEVQTEEDRRLARILYERLDEAVVKAVETACRTGMPVRAGWGSTPCGLNVNRNVQTPRGWWLGSNERAYSDHTLRCLRLCHDDTPLAVILNYDCQPSVLDGVVTRAGQRLLSGDFAGAALAELERRYPGLVAFYLPGAAGDQAPLLRGSSELPDGERYLLQEEAFVLAAEQGRYLAGCAEGPLRHVQGESETANLAPVRRVVKVPEQQMRYTTRELVPHRTYDFRLTGRYLEVPLLLLYIGEIPILLTPPELNSSFGRLLRQRLGENAIIGTLVNGAMKYLPEAADYDRITYTSMNTMLGRGGDAAFVRAVDEMVGQGS